MKAIACLVTIFVIYSVNVAAQNPCAGAPDGSRLPVDDDCTRFYLCQGGQNIKLNCGSSARNFNRCTQSCEADASVCALRNCPTETTTAAGATTTAAGVTTTVPGGEVTTTVPGGEVTTTVPGGEVTTTVAGEVTTTVANTRTPATVPVETTAGGGGAETTTLAETTTVASGTCDIACDCELACDCTSTPCQCTPGFVCYDDITTCEAPGACDCTENCEEGSDNKFGCIDTCAVTCEPLGTTCT